MLAKTKHSTEERLQSFKVGEKQFRSFQIRKEDLDEASRSISLSFSSETPVKRQDWYGDTYDEILDHDDGCIDDSRLQNGAPLLVNHSMDDQVGVCEPGTFKVEKAEGEAGKKGRLVARFGNSARANEIFQDVKDGIRGLVSVGYQVHDWETKESDEGLESVRVTRWEPLEVSLVGVPADKNVGVGREFNPQKKEPHLKTRILRDPTPEPGGNGPDVIVAVNKARDSEMKRMAELDALGDKFNCREEATKWKQNQATQPEEAMRWILENRMNAKPVTPAQTDVRIGMDGKDLQRYSLVRAMRCLANERPMDGFELDCSQEVSKKLGRSPSGRGFFIPEDYQSHRPSPVRGQGAMARLANILTRALGATTGNAGGFTVQTDVLGENLIELLRNRTFVMKLGARMLSGLVGDVAIPKQTGPGSTYWLAEGTQIPAAQQVLGQLLLKPHMLGARTIYSKQLLAQSSIDIESFVREDLMLINAIALDLAAINGSGGAQPIGILNTTGVNSETFGATATWAKLLQFETDIATQNADVENMNWLSTPATRGKLKQTLKVSASTFPIYLWDDDNEINGYPAYVSNQVPGNQVLFGDWEQLIVATWAGLEVIVNPYTYASSGQVEVNTIQLADVGIRHPESFAVSTDSGAQ